MGNDIVNILNIYAPNNIKERKQFFDSLYPWTEKCFSDNYYTVIAGDFNCALTTEDRSSGKIDLCSKSLAELMKQFNVVDIWKSKNPNDIGFTWGYNNKRTSSSRIDYIFCPKVFPV